MLIPSTCRVSRYQTPSLSRRVNANSQRLPGLFGELVKLIKKGEC